MNNILFNFAISLLRSFMAIGQQTSYNYI